MKLNVIVAKAKDAGTVFKNVLKEKINLFKNHQALFQGHRKTYIPAENTMDEPSKREFRPVQSTVGEQLDQFEAAIKNYINHIFSIEATNAGGKCRAPLTVNGQYLGTLSSLELLRLKSFLESGELNDLYTMIPVRNNLEIWTPSEDDEHKEREIFCNKILESKNYSSVKEDHILVDPNIGKSPGYNPAPQVSTKTTHIVLGDATYQKFSGEYTHTQRAGFLQRKSQLLNEVVAALKTANDVEAIDSELTAGNLFDFLHRGKITTDIDKDLD